jgi:hypothetical protein
LIPIKPGPAIGGLPVVHSDDAEHDWFSELRACVTCDAENIARPR